MAIGPDPNKQANAAYRSALAETARELEARIFEMGSLRQIGELFGKSSRLDEVVTRGLEILLGASPAERGSVMLYSPATEELCLLAAGTRGSGQVIYFGPGGNPERSFQVGEGLAGRCLEHNEAIVSDDVTKEPRFVPSAKSRIKVGSIACMPLAAEGRPLGVVNLSASTPGQLTAEQLPLLSILSSYLGIALSNAMLVQRLTDSNEELEKKVRERTRKLEETNSRLMEAQAEISAHNETLQDKVQERTQSLERALSDLRERTESLERANRVKDEFLNNINHELKTPLNAVIGYAGLLRKEAGSLSEEQKADLSLIESNGRHLQQILDNIFALKAIEGGDLIPELRPTDLDELVRTAAASVSPRAREKGLDLLVEVASAMPRLDVDPTLILRVVYNLLDNAIKFSDRGAIRVTTRNDERNFYLDVADQGPGIKSNDAERVFEKFFQAEPAMRKRRGGSGVGLTIARTLARLHGGEITHGPAEGGGSVFTLRLPLPL